MVVLTNSLLLDAFQTVKQDVIKDVQLIMLVDTRDIIVMTFV